MEVLRAHAGEQPARRAFTFLDQGEEESGHLTYGELDRQARTIAARLQEEGAGAGPALLLYPPGLEFIAGFFGCLYAGVVGVPVYPPGSPRGLPLLRSVAADCRPELILTTAARRARFAALTAELPALAGARWIASDAPAGDPNAWRPPDLAADRLAFLQYTSGSTAAPRGVMVTHGNLLHNQEAIRHTFGQSSASVIVGWLPLYHDMGLIGNVLQTVYVGASAVLMPPAAFLQRPARWLQAISRYRGTASGGPNFAFDLCVRRIDGADREQLDLGSWEVAYNGAETVRRETLESFAAAFAPCGFRPASLFPCYGLAEATLLVSGGAWQPSSGAVEPAGPAAERRPGCGRPAPGIEVAIADPVGGERRGPGEVGEIWVSGLGVARGYWRRPEESESTFQARLAGAPESAGAFLRTGDLGFLRGGELVVTGRLKELLVVRGRNHYPQDLELTAERAHPALRPGCGAAFAVEATAADGERLVLAYELARGSAAAAPYEVAAAVARALAAEHELRLHELVLLRPGSLPKTSSGKIRRRACRDGYLEGSLEVVARGGPTGAPDACSAEESAADGLPPEGSPVLLRELAAAAGVASDRFDPALPLTAYGLDSLAAALLQHRLETRLGIAVSVADLLAAESASALVETLLARSAEEESSAARPSPAEPDVASDLVLSPGQEWFWFLDRLLPGNPASTLIAVARVLSPLDVAALRQACTDLVARHGALRTTFHASAAGTPLRRVGRHPELYFQLLTSAAAGDATPEERLLAELHRPFDLETGPLLRIVVLAEDGETPRLGLAIHHLAADFWSLTVLAGELGIFYDRTCGEAAPLPAPLASGYDEHVLSLRRWLAGPRAEREWAYWSVRLAGAPFTLDLPTDHPRPPLPSFRGAAVRLRLGPAAEVAELASAHRTTPFAVLLASYLALLGRVTDQDDLLVGTPAAGRGAAGEAGVVGYFVNPLVLRAGLAGDLEFSTLLARTRAEVLAALAHQDLPFPLLAERLQPDRDPSRQPLFQAMFVLYRAPLEGLAACAIGEPGAAFGLGGLRLETLAGEERGAPSELTLRLAQVGGELVASLQYSTDLFEAVTARRLLRQFATLLGAALAAPGSRLDGLPLLAEAERQQLLGEWSEAAPPPAGEGWLHQLVLAQA
ncbi:MAG TPA: condensation domain-containing protein, partial [Thermoanaerobaculia bacterium]|nr:condensation domain-containing protein [Thermoanaerobaculia bacterium]